jgi:hypothetical protein
MKHWGMSNEAETEAAALTIADLRREMGLSLAEFGALIGLASKGNVSLIERGAPCSLTVALAIEKLSGGRIDAAHLSADVAAARCTPVAPLAPTRPVVASGEGFAL